MERRIRAWGVLLLAMAVALGGIIAAHAEPVTEPVDPLTAYESRGSDSRWQDIIYSLGEDHVGRQYLTFTVTPAADGIEGFIGFAGSAGAVEDMDGLPVLLRLNANGMFDARNADGFARAADIPYAADGTYAVALTIDMAQGTYTAYITPPEGERTLLADAFAFWPAAGGMGDLSRMYLANAGEDGLLTVEEVKRLEVYDPGKAYLSTGENLGWQQKGIYLGREYAGKLRIRFDMTKLIDTVDASVDFADGDIDVYGFGDLSMLIRVYIDTNLFDVRNVTQQERLADVAMDKGVPYHVEVEADMDTKLYSVWVTRDMGERVQVARDYGFRATAAHADSISKVYVISAHENDSMQMTNLTIEEIK